MVEVPVKGDVLKWARERRDFSVSEVSEKLKWSEDTLSAFEDERTKPNIGDLKKLAKAYDMAFASLLVSERPAYEEKFPEDFRTFAGKSPKFSPKMRRVIEEVNEIIDVLYDISDEMVNSFPDMSSFPKISIGDNNIEKIAAKERRRIGPSIEDHLQWEKARDVFYLFRSAIEKEGIFVYVTNMGDEGNCRGIAFIDERNIAFIVINSAETQYEARLFTLIHEYAHILLRRGGLSDHNPKNKIEKFCNQFAADFLLPRDIFRGGVEKITGGRDIKEQDLSKIAKRFKLSKSVVALHLWTCHIVPDDRFYKNLISEIYAPIRKKKQGYVPQITHEKKEANRFGVGLLDLVHKAYEKNLFNEMDVYELTGIKPKYMDSIAEEVRERQQKYGHLHP